MSKSALILTHVELEGACLYGRILDELGFFIKTVNVAKMDIAELDAQTPDLFMIMGGPIGVYQSDDYEFLRTEVDIIRKRLEADKPTLGICLGGQLMASALGAKVYPGQAGPEVGWVPLSLTEAGQSHPVRHLGQDNTNMFHWHADTFDLPKDATLLASSDNYQNQIFSIGKNGLGLQCHPEVTGQKLREWYIMLVQQVTGPNAVVPLKELKAQTEIHIEKLNQQSRVFFMDWLQHTGLYEV